MVYATKITDILLATLKDLIDRLFFPYFEYKKRENAFCQVISNDHRVMLCWLIGIQILRDRARLNPI